MYLSPSLVGNSFERLRESEPSKKAGVERTTGLFRFLAFDTLCKMNDESSLLFDPSTGLGRKNRESLVSQYSDIALIKQLEDRKEWIVDNLGSCNTDCRRTCNDKIANDFLTAPLSKASKSAKVQPYPRRPSSLLNLGIEIAGKPWGISKHEEWNTNIYDFHSDRWSQCFWIDLAVFLARKEKFRGKDFWLELADFLSNRFSKELIDFWNSKIRFEKKKFAALTDLENWTSPTFENVLENQIYAKPRNKNTEELISKLKKENLDLKKENLDLRNINRQLELEIESVMKD